MIAKKVFTLAAVTAVVFALAGALLGTLLGMLIPEHYYSVFLIPPDSNVSAVWLGAQLGLTQGFIAGLIVGLVVVVPLALRRARITKQTDGARPRMSPKKKIVLAGLLAFFLVASVPVGFFIFFVAASSGHDQGSPKLAALWRDTLDKYNTPDEAAKHVHNLQVASFDNGQWAFGLAQNSHGAWLRGNGTIVVKDSQGNTRAFFGHVCGPSWLKRSLSNNTDLDAFYAKLKDRDFVEHDFQKPTRSKHRQH